MQILESHMQTVPAIPAFQELIARPTPTRSPAAGLRADDQLIIRVPRRQDECSLFVSKLNFKMRLQANPQPDMVGQMLEPRCGESVPRLSLTDAGRAAPSRETSTARLCPLTALLL